MTPTAPLSAPSPAVEAARTAHALAHWEYRNHVQRCSTLEALQRPCRTCDVLLIAADDAGIRWERTERAALVGAV